VSRQRDGRLDVESVPIYIGEVSRPECGAGSHAHSVAEHRTGRLRRYRCC